ncbi:alr0857 family protein [Leptolyngbya ohadii]|uniref:alr0857 family protein n=1 Tax=Leptolyngbya ohadii TaxID=1962290 RepID=UPI000B5A0C94|nr:alr0857 family protein [Leptolyngbya ohadii]
MLKLTYTETGLYLELVPESIEEWLHLRLTLSLRTSQSFHLEPGTASFLLPTDLPGLNRLHRLINRTEQEITLTTADHSSVEISLRGIWIASTTHETEGVFVAAIDRAVEALLFDLWQVSEMHISSLRS